MCFNLSNANAVEGFYIYTCEKFRWDLQTVKIKTEIKTER